MQLSSTLAWLVDAAGASPDAGLFLAELGARLIDDGLPLAGGALTLAAPHPIIAHRTWLWRSDSGTVIEALGIRGGGTSRSGAGGSARRCRPGLAGRARAAVRFASAPLAALTARATLTAALEAYLGRRSAARVLTGPLRRGASETIRAALLCADLRGFTALSETAPPAAVIAALDAWFDRIAGSVHAFGGEVLKFLGDGMLAIFPVAENSPGAACDAALSAVSAARAGMAHLDEARRRQGLPPLPFGAAVHLGEFLWGNIGAADRLDFTAIGPAVNLVSRLEGLCRPLDRAVLVSGAVAAETKAPLIPLGMHALRGIASPCAVCDEPRAPIEQKRNMFDRAVQTIN